MEKLLEQLSLVLDKCEGAYIADAKGLVVQLKESLARSTIICFPTYTFDVDREILSHVDDNLTLMAALLTCKWLYQLISDEILWKMRIKLKYDLRLDEYVTSYKKSYKYYYTKLVDRVSIDPLYTTIVDNILALAASEGLTKIFVEFDRKVYVNVDPEDNDLDEIHDDHLSLAVSGNHSDIVDYLLGRYKGLIITDVLSVLPSNMAIVSRLIDAKVLDLNDHCSTMEVMEHIMK